MRLAVLMSSPMLTDNDRPSWPTCELLAGLRFTALGYAVSLPITPQTYDLVVDVGETPARLLRVQVKRAKYRAARARKLGVGDRACYEVQLTRKAFRSGKAPRGNRRMAATEFDYLVAVCEWDQVYVIPTKALESPEKPGIVLRAVRIKPPAMNRRVDSLKAGARWETYLNQFTL